MKRSEIGMAFVAIFVGICIGITYVRQTGTNEAQANLAKKLQNEESDRIKHDLAAEVDPSPNPPTSEFRVTEKDIEAAIDQISEWSGISRERIRSLSPLARHTLAQRFLAQKLGKSIDEIGGMSKQEMFDDAIKVLADKYGISYAETKILADLQEKMDSGRSLSSDELKFVAEMDSKMRRNGK